MISRILTHVRPHLDEIVGIWLLRRFGEGRFPGITEASVEVIAGGSDFDLGRSEEGLESEGTLCLGIGPGFKFNHHPHAEYGEECTATLVAKHLGVEDDPALEQILGYTLENDLRGKGANMDLAHLIGVLNKENPENPEKVVEWAMPAIEAKYQEQMRFFGTVKEEFRQNARIFEVPFVKGTITVASICSDQPEMAKFAHSKHGAGANVVILKHPATGQVQILTRNFPQVRLMDVVQTIRIEEQRAEGGEVRITNWETLRSDGTVEGIDKWYYLADGEKLLNGSNTAPHIPPTRLSLEKIEGIVTHALNLSYFADCCPQVGCIGPRCPLYQYGWHRCRKRRYEARK